jgi:hypothetical protein
VGYRGEGVQVSQRGLLKAARAKRAQAAVRHQFFERL